MFPFIQCQYFDKRRDVFTGKIPRFFKIRVLIWADISALGVSLNFDNERMYPLDTEVPPRVLNSVSRSARSLCKCDWSCDWFCTGPLPLSMNYILIHSYFIIENLI